VFLVLWKSDEKYNKYEKNFFNALTYITSFVAITLMKFIVIQQHCK